MKVRVLGSGAGGGLPQWNCGCTQCRDARAGAPGITPRTQSSVCVSADGERWLLVNASPDVRAQLNSFAPLGPRPGALRGSGVAAVALTNADIDHCAGLLVLREGGAPPIYTTVAVREALTHGLSILPVLGAYGPVDWGALPLGEACEPRDRDERSLGLELLAFPVTSKPPPYVRPVPGTTPSPGDRAGDTVGLLVRASTGGATLAYVPGVRDLDEALYTQLTRADVILIDGTFYTDDELVALGASAKTARVMGHAPLTHADGGLLAFLDRLPRARRVLVHMNNSNPVLTDGSAARREVERHGVEVGYDGMDLELPG